MNSLVVVLCSLLTLLPLVAYGDDVFMEISSLPGLPPVSADPYTQYIVSRSSNQPDTLVVHKPIEPYYSHKWLPDKVLHFPDSVVSLEVAALAIQGDIVAVGPIPGLYIFNLTTEAEVLTASFSLPNLLCNAVEVFADRVYCGEGTYGNKSIGIYAYDANAQTWSQVARIPGPKGHFAFGKTLRVTQNTIIVGDTDFGGKDEGAVFIYQQSDPIGTNYTLAASFYGTFGGQEFSVGLALNKKDNMIAVGSHYNGGVALISPTGGPESTNGWHVVTVMRLNQTTHFGFAVTWVTGGLVVLAPASAYFVTFDTSKNYTMNCNEIASELSLNAWQQGYLSNCNESALLAVDGKVLVFGWGPARATRVVVITCSLAAVVIVGAALAIYFWRSRRQGYEEVINTT